MKKYFAVALAAFSLATANAALVGRDINGNAVAGNAANSVFLYDDVTNLTWLQNWGLSGMRCGPQRSAELDWSQGWRSLPRGRNS